MRRNRYSKSEKLAKIYEMVQSRKALIDIDTHSSRSNRTSDGNNASYSSSENTTGAPICQAMKCKPHNTQAATIEDSNTTKPNDVFGSTRSHIYLEF